MDVLEFLKHIRRKRMELAIIEQHEDELRLSLLPGAIRYDIDKVQTSPVDRMPEMMAKLTDLQEKEADHKAALIADIQRAIEMVNQVPTPEYRTILRLRYLEGGVKPMSWDQIADTIGYSSISVRGYMHGRAIAEIREIWNRCKT